MPIYIYFASEIKYFFFFFYFDPNMFKIFI